MKPMLCMMQEHPNVELQLIATDQHLNQKFGKTINEIERDFAVAAKVNLQQRSGSSVDRAIALGNCISEMAKTLSILKPDILLLYGDRGEVIASAISATHLRIPIGHMQGGDRTGNVDESIRHAVTKLSHLHFVSCEQSAQRVRGLGEQDNRIFVVGDHHLDPLFQGEMTASGELSQKFQLNNERPILCIFHPETIRMRNHKRDIDIITNEVVRLGKRTMFIYPCSDHGYEEIVEGIESVKHLPKVSIHKNIDAADFAGLMKIASILVGNSSAGIVEAPFFGLPVVNVDERQLGRMRSENVIDCEIDAECLSAALKRASSAQFTRTANNCSQPYGNGEAGKATLEILLHADLSAAALLEKTDVLGKP